MSIRILVADDDPLMRVLVAVSLAGIAETVEAADGDEVLRLLSESEIEILREKVEKFCRSTPSTSISQPLELS